MKQDTKTTAVPGSDYANASHGGLKTSIRQPHPGARRAARRLASVLLLAVGMLLAVLWFLGHPHMLRAAPPPLRYVAPGGSDAGNDCTNRYTPCATVQRAVNQASPGDEIRVAAGRYSENIALNTSVTVRGGFTTTNWVEPNPDQHITIIDAQGTGDRPLHVASGVVATVSGFHLTGGLLSSGHGGGVYNEGTLTLTGNRVYGNVVSSFTGTGGGIANDPTNPSATLTLRNTRVYSNVAAFYGGGVSILQGDVLIEASEIFNNSADDIGGIAVIDGNITVRSSLIYSNTAVFGSGGGIGIYDGAAYLANNTIYDNSAASRGGGIYADDGVIVITNTLVVSNTASATVGNGGGGIYDNTLWPPLGVSYTDFYGNLPNHIQDPSGAVPPTSYSSSNRTINPQFVDPQNYDLHLSGGSPAINSGTAAVEAPIDFEGHGRPFDGAFDRGADEFILTLPCYARIEDGPVYIDVQSAIDSASSGDTVQVAGYCAGVATRGSTTQAAYINKSLTLRGGYTTTDWIAPVYGPAVLDAQDAGRGVYATGSTPITVAVEGFRIVNGQSADYAGGVYLGDNVIATLQNNIIHDNTATTGGGGVMVDGANVLLRHNTIYGNSAGAGGGIYLFDGALNLRSTLVINNQGNGLQVASGGYTLAYNDFYGNTPLNYSGATPGATDISADPGFVNAGAGDFHLTLTSPAVNGADPATPVTVDFEGHDRPQGNRSDIGADESITFADVDLREAAENPVLVTDLSQIQGQDFTFNHTIVNIGTTADQFDVVATNSDGWPITVTAPSPVSLAAGGSQTFAVIVSVPSTVTTIYNRTTITATSRTNPTGRDVVVDEIGRLGVEMTPNYTENADPGEVVTYTHILTNVGPLDTFTITLTSSRGWGQLIVPPDGFITLGNDETALVIATVRVTSTAPAGLADVTTIRATSSFSVGVFAVVTDTTIANPTTGDRFVAPAFNGGVDFENNCTQEGYPCATISYALDQAAWGDTIRVAQGTYNESNLIINQRVNLRGGYTYSGGTFTRETIDPTLSIIDAQHTGRGMYVNVASAYRPLIEGFTIRNGTTDGFGGGILLLSGSSPTLTQLLVTNNSASRGGGIYATGGNPIIDGVRVANNTAVNQGGGVYQEGGTLDLWNNFIYSNTVTNNSGGGVYQAGGTLHLFNNTLYKNQAPVSGGGVYKSSAGTTVFSNTIVMANSAASGGGFYHGGGGLTIDYNVFWNNSAASYPDSNVATGPHSRSIDPLLVDVATANLHLAADSPCIDTGDPNTTLISDIDLDIRPTHQTYDVGADEFGGCLARVVEPANRTPYPDPENPVLYGVVQRAIDAAPEGYIVQISGICRGALPRVVGGRTISQTAIITKALSLEGGYNSLFNNDPASAPLTTTLDAQGMGRVLVVTSLLTDTVAAKVSRLTLTGGDAAGLGGGPSDNDAGGGVYVHSSTLKILGSTISYGQATYGGGVYIDKGAVDLHQERPEVVERPFIISNTATYGGGVCLGGNTARIGDVLVGQNTATQGGGVYNVSSSGLVSQTLIYTNTAGSGGGIYNAIGARLSTLRSVVLHNTASTGGGLLNPATGILTLTNTIVASNTATLNGGGLHNQASQLTVRHDTFYGNSAGGQGGGIYNNTGSGNPVINSTILVYNTASSGGAIYNVSAAPQFRYNDVYGNSSGTTPSGVGNISADPNFLSTDPFGGQFLRLPGGSPAEDTADPASPVEDDIDGEPRPSNRGYDIGADEVGGCYVRINGEPPTYGSIQLAVEESQSVTDTLYVAGTCAGAAPFFDNGQIVSQTVVFTKSLSVRGGYTLTNWTISDPISNPTTLDALRLGRVIYITNSAVVSMTGLHIRGGLEEEGGGIYVGNSVLTMTGNYIHDNQATSGGALHHRMGTVYLISNRIYSNTATNGGVIYHAGGVAWVWNNFVWENRATGNGGGVYNNSNNIAVWHNTFYSNTATNGGGLYTTNGNPSVVNNIFAQNVASVGHAIHGPVSSDYNDVYPLVNGYGGGASAGSHSLSVDPLFIAPLLGDFHLPVDSPVLDRGNPAMTLLYDIDGHMRPGDQGFDMGADEIPSCWGKIVRTGVVYGNVQLAIDRSQAGDVILVTSDYPCRSVHPLNVGGRIISQTVHIAHNLTLIGGYDEGFTEIRAISPTVLLPMGRGRAMVITGTTPPITPTLIALTVTNFMLTSGDAAGLGGGPGGSDAGGGLYYHGGSNTLITGTTFCSNTAPYGGGGYIATSGLTITHSFAWGNIASFGGGLYNGSPRLELLNTEIYQNDAVHGGGGFYNGGTTLLDLGNRLHDNYAEDGAALYNTGVLTMWNTLVYSNTARNRGAGLYNQGSSPSILHNTFYNNDVLSFEGQGGAIYSASGAPTIKNNIFANNWAWGGGDAITATGGIEDYNDYYFMDASWQVEGTIVTGTHNLNEYPDFEDVEAADFHLAPTSPLIDEAELGLGVDHDFEGDPRPINTEPDIGADEMRACLAQVWRGGSPVSPVYGHIQEAINVANAAQNDVIRVAEGVCEEHLTIDKDVTIVGSWERDFSEQVKNVLGSVILCTRVDALAEDRVVTISSAAGSVDISWLILENGYTTGDGGGVWSAADSLDLSDFSVYSNTAANGGGVYISRGTAYLHGPDRGGSIGLNVASGDGGGVYAAAGSEVDISGAALWENEAAGDGGGVYNAGTDLSIRNVDVDTNEATNGGGVYLSANSPTELVNVLFYSNTATVNGGGLYRDGSAGSIDLRHNTFNRNAASGLGGGLYNTGGTMWVHSSIVANNTSGSGGSGIHGTSGANVSVNYTLRWNNTYSGATLEGSGNILDQNPVFWSSDGSHLNYPSPAIDSIPSAASPIDYDRTNDGRPQICAKDMGVDEYGVGERQMTWVEGTPTPPEATVVPGGAITYTFALRNDSEHWLDMSDSLSSLGEGTGYTETVTLRLISSKGWAEIVGLVGGVNASIQTGGITATVTLGPGQTANILVRVDVPPEALASIENDDNTKEITEIRSFARQCPDGPEVIDLSPPAKTSVATLRDFIIAPDYFGAALPGQTLTFTHIITNIGNITDTYDIIPDVGFYAAGEIAQPLPPQITLTPHQTETLVISITIQPQTAGGLTSLTGIIGRSIGDPEPENWFEKAAVHNLVVSYTTGTRHVSLDGSDSLVNEPVVSGDPGIPDYADNNCTQPDVGACRTLQHAIDQAAPGDLIKIDQGTYSDVSTTTLRIATVNESVILQGGYDKDVDPGWDAIPPDHTAHPTILDPQGAGRALYVTGGVTVTLDRLAIRDGDATGLGGGPSGENAGGNVYNAGGNLYLNAVRLYDGYATLGGGLYHAGGELMVQNSLLHGNEASTNGGAIYVNAGATTLQNDTFYDNQASSNGSAVYAAGGTLAITNTIVAENTSAGGAIHGTMAGALAYNLYYNNTASHVGGSIAIGSNNLIDQDPRFVNTGAIPPDLHLQSNSPAKETGDPATNVNLIPISDGRDYENNPRPLNTRVDIGAYEYVYARGVQLEPDHAQIADQGQVITYTHTLTNIGEIADTIAITFASNQGWATLLTPSSVPLAAGGTATVRVRVQVPSVGVGGLQDITVVTATTGYPYTSDTAVNTTTVRMNPGVTFTPDRSGTTSAGRVITYAHTLRNDGDGPDTFILSHLSSQGWAVTYNTPVPLGYGEETTVIVSIAVPAGTVSGTVDTTTITATSSFDAGVADNVVDTTTITGTPDIAVTPLALDATLPPGGTTNRTLTISNTGTANLTWSLAENPGVTWLSESSTGGTVVPAGGTGVTVDFSAAGLIPGTYNTTLRITSNDPDEATVDVPVALTVSEGCVPVSGASFNLTPSSPTVGQAVTFNGSVVQGSEPITYTWSFGDGSPVQTGNPVIHTFATANTFSVVMTATNDCGQATATGDVTVGSAPDIEVSPLALSATLNPDDTTDRTLTISNTGSSDLTWSLTENPGVGWLSETPTGGAVVPAGSEGVTVVFDSTGLSAGVYNTILRITSNDPDESPLDVPVVLTVTTDCIPIAGVDFTVEPVPPVEGQVVTFTATFAQGSRWSLVYVWDFGDGSAPGGTNPIAHTYTTHGVYNVEVTVSNACPSTEAYNRDVVIYSTQPDIDVTPSEMNVTLYTGQTDTRPLTVSNAVTTTAGLTWNLAEMPDVGWLSEASTSGVLVPAGSETVIVTFDASTLSPSIYYTTLRITSDDPDEPTVDVNVTLTVLEVAHEVYLPLVFRNWPPPDGPDLVVTNLVVTPASPQAGVSASLCVTVRNQGTMPVAVGNNFFIDIYVDRVPDQLQGEVWWGVQGSWFGVNQSLQFCDSYTFTSGGTHQLYAQVDTGGWVTEQYEDNNILGPVAVSVTGAKNLEAPTLPTPIPQDRTPRPTPTPGP